MQNPFESGQIKNYLLFYASILIIIILFFIASTLFNDVQVREKKVFDMKVKEKVSATKSMPQEKRESKFKLLDKAY